MYGIRNCDTVKKARAWLDERGVEYRFHDYKNAGVVTEKSVRVVTVGVTAVAR